MTDTVRVYDLAKELNLTNKEVIEKLDTKLGVKVKSHSSVISESQAKKLKELLQEPQAAQTKKPKAFVVKKAKQKVKNDYNWAKIAQDTHFTYQKAICETMAEKQRKEMEQEKNQKTKNAKTAEKGLSNIIAFKKRQAYA